MSFELRAGPSRNLRLASLAPASLGLCGLGWSAATLIADGSPGRALLLLLAAIAIWRLPARWVRRVDIRGVLRVESSGQAWWVAAPAEMAVPLRPRRWFAGLGLVWIEGEAGGRPISMIFGADAIASEARIGLDRWLRWIDRGGVPEACDPAASSPSAGRTG